MKYLHLFLCLFLLSCQKEDVPLNVATKIDQLYSEAKTIQQTNPEKAQQLAGSGLKLAKDNHYIKGEADGLFLLGTTSSYQGAYGAAVKYFVQALPIRQELKDHKGLAQVYNALGTAYQYCLLYTDAEEYFNTGLQISQQLPDKEMQAKMERSLGLLYQQQEQYEKAGKHFEKSLALFQSLKSKYTGYLYNDLAIVKEMYPNPDYRGILSLYQNVFLVSKQQNDQIGVGLALLNSGRMYTELKDTGKALSYMRDSKNYFKGNAKHTVLALQGEAEILLSMGKVQEAKNIVSEAEELIPALVGVQKQRGVELYRFAQTLYATNPDKLQSLKEKESALVNELKQVQQSIQIEQLTEQAQLHRVKRDSLQQTIGRMEVAENRFYWAMAVIITLLVVAIWLFIKYYKLTHLFHEFIIARDPVLRHFDKPW